MPNAMRQLKRLFYYKNTFVFNLENYSPRDIFGFDFQASLSKFTSKFSSVRTLLIFRCN